MEKKEIVEFVMEIMKRTRAGFMSTLNEDGLPEIRAIKNFWCPELYEGHPAKVLAEIEEDPLTIYVSTNTSSTKVKQIKENPNVAIYYSIPEEYKGVMFQGEVEIMDDVDFKKMLWYKSAIRLTYKLDIGFKELLYEQKSEDELVAVVDDQ